MDRTTQIIEKLSEALSHGGPCSQALCRASLESVARLAILEYVSAPILATHTDMQQLAEIRKMAMK